MLNKVLSWIVIAVGVILIAIGLIFLCAAINQPSRLWLSIVLLALGAALVAWGAVSLRRARDLTPEAVADRIVTLVRRRGNAEITLADATGSLGVSHEAAEQAFDVLSRRQVVQREYHGGRFVYIFPQLRELKAVRKCPYCGSEFSVKKALQKCPNCGANLEITKE